MSVACCSLFAGRGWLLIAELCCVLRVACCSLFAVCFALLVMCC